MDNAKEVVKTVKAPKPQTAPKKRKGKSLERQKAKMGWLFVAPFLIGFVLIYLPLIFESLKFSRQSRVQSHLLHPGHRFDRCHRYN